VDKAVISHLHSDHVGGIADIPQADLYAGEEGFDYMRGPDHPERQTVYRDRIEIPGARWHMIPFEPTDDPALAPFTEAFDLMGDGSMIVLPTPGHLPGSVSMLVRRAARHRCCSSVTSPTTSNSSSATRSEPSATPSSCVPPTRRCAR
jgi:N-acyl homoserine lactone hydrolase